MVEQVKFYSRTNTDFYNVLKMIFSYDKQLICQTIIIVFFIFLDRILNSDCIVYLPMADGDAIAKWDKEFVAEMLYSNVSNGR